MRWAAPRPGRATEGASGGLEPSSTLPMGIGGSLLPHCRVGGWKYTPVPQLGRVPSSIPGQGTLGVRAAPVGTTPAAGMQALVSRGTAAGARTQMQPVFSRAVASHPIASHRIAASISGRLSGSRRRRRCAHAPPSPDRQWPESFACSRGPTSSLSGGTSLGARRCGRLNCSLCLPVCQSIGRSARPPVSERWVSRGKRVELPHAPPTLFINPPPRRTSTQACMHAPSWLYLRRCISSSRNRGERALATMTSTCLSIGGGGGRGPGGAVNARLFRC